MIKSITPKSGLLKDLNIPKLTFDDDITLIVGKNGSGKSALLKTIHHYFPSEFIEPFHLSKGFGEKSFNYYLNGFHSRAEFEYTGGKVHLVDAREYANVHARFDADMANTMLRMMSHDSRGEDMMKAVNSLFEIDSNFEDYLVFLNEKKKSVNDVWRDAIDMYKDYYEPYDHTQKPTLLIDEYDTSFDLDHQNAFIHHFLPELAKKWQVICVSHSIFAHLSPHKVICLDDSRRRIIKFFKESWKNT